MPVAARSIANLRAGGGRAGMPAKIPQSIKEMIERALHKAGGVDYLARQAEQNPVAFMSLVGRVLPLQLANADGQALVVDFRWADNTNVATATIEHNGDTTSVDTQPEAIEVEWKDAE